MCMVSIDPVTSSDESTQFAAKCVDVIAPSAIIVPDIAFVAISSACTLVRAMLLFYPADGASEVAFATMPNS